MRKQPNQRSSESSALPPPRITRANLVLASVGGKSVWHEPAGDGRAEWRRRQPALDERTGELLYAMVRAVHFGEDIVRWGLTTVHDAGTVERAVCASVGLAGTTLTRMCPGRGPRGTSCPR